MIGLKAKTLYHQAEGLPGLVCERPEPLQEARVDRYGRYGACWIPEVGLHLELVG